MKKLFLVLLPVLLLLAGLFSSCKREGAAADPNVAYYTCTMHPSVRSQDPKAKCPICGMNLVPVMKKGAQSNAPNASTANAAKTIPVTQTNAELSEFMVSPARQQMIGVTYAKIESKQVQQTIRAVGIVTYDKQRHWDFVSRVEGYVQKLEVSSRGDTVEKGQPLLTIYSPDLLTAQNEFLDALRIRDEAMKSNQPALVENGGRLLESARRRLFLWNITEKQINELEQSQKPTDTLTLYSPFKGVVQNLQVDQGRRVMVGDHLVDVADLSVIWVWAEFYQDELPLLKKEQAVMITSSSYPGEKFCGKIALIDPFLDENKRTGRIRIEVPNAEMKLRPEMFVDVAVEIDFGTALVIPASAVLPTGGRSLVFLDKGEGKIEPRFVQLKRKVGERYIVAGGLLEDESVIASANFLIDAESKVQGAVKTW